MPDDASQQTAQHAAPAGSQQRRHGLGRRPFLTGLAAAALAAPGLRAQRRDERQRERDEEASGFELTTPELAVAGLDEAHDGLVIGHLTDIHIGPRTPDQRVLAAVDALNAARPDIVFLTGDYITRKGDPLERIPDLLGRLQVPAVAVLGNHDHWTDAATITRDLERIGIAVLRNRHTVVQVRGRALAVVGVDDAVSGHDDVADAFKGVARHAPRLVLAHSPPTLDALPPDAGLACFSGHTHGGQFLPWNFFVPLQQPFTAGLERWKDMWVYTSRGTGYWGPPVRVMAPSEITRLRLVAA